MSKKKIFSTILIIALTLILFIICFCLSSNVLTQLPSITQMNYNLKSDNLPLTVKDVENLSEQISLNCVSFCSELDETNVKGETVTPVLTNENYFEIYGHELNGSNITKVNIENKDNVAVIGSNIAIKMFFNTEVIGNTITLNEEVFTICGVFYENENILNDLSGDGKQRIYIPYTCYSKYENCGVNTISYENSSSSAPLIEQMNLSQYHSTNFSEKVKVIKNFEHIIFLIVFIALCFISIKLWYFVCKTLTKDIKENLSEEYFFNSLESIPLKYVFLIITVLGIPTILYIIFLALDFSVFIIPKYIPYDNIFDLSYYISRIIENSNNTNCLALTGDAFFINLYSSSFILLVWLVIIFFLSFIALVYMINMAINRKILLVQNRK